MVGDLVMVLARRRAVCALVSILALLLGLAAGCAGGDGAEAPVAKSPQGTAPTQTQDGDAVRVAGITLVPVSGELRRQCKTTARRLGYGVPCPGLLPEGAQPTPLPPDLRDSPFADYFIRPGFRGFSDWVVLTVYFPAQHLESHLVISASPRVVDGRHFAYLEPAPSERVVIEGPQRLRGQRAQWVYVPPASSSSFGGHTILLWSSGGHTYGVGFHGRDLRIRELDLAVAESVEIVEP